MTVGSMLGGDDMEGLLVMTVGSSVGDNDMEG